MVGTGGRGSYTGQAPPPWRSAGTTSTKAAQHSISQQHPEPGQGNKAPHGKRPGIFEIAAPPSHFLASESAVWHPGRCLKWKYTESILVSTEATPFGITGSRFRWSWIKAGPTLALLSRSWTPCRKSCPKNPLFKRALSFNIVRAGAKSMCSRVTEKFEPHPCQVSRVIRDEWPTLWGVSSSVAGSNSTYFALLRRLVMLLFKYQIFFFFNFSQSDWESFKNMLSTSFLAFLNRVKGT